MFAFTEFLFGLVDEDNVDLVLFEWDLMLLEKLNHALDLVNEDLNLWGQFLIVTDNLHDFSQ